jgi:uncharacterized protein YcbX
MRVADLFIYPVKGARAVPVPSAAVEPAGFADDRRWMLVDESARAVTQRELPALARLVAEPDGNGGLRLLFDGESLAVRRSGADAPRVPVTIWRDALRLREAAEAAPVVSRWFGRPLRLVQQGSDATRPIDPAWGDKGDVVSLADGFPILVATTASLEALCLPVGMDRFRPNLVIEGSEPWAEDGWRRLKVGAVELDLPKPCARCVVTTVDQVSGAATGPEPLDSLRAKRLSADRRNPGVLFGWNAVPIGAGTVRVGDPVEVAAAGEPWPVRSAAPVA